MTFVVDTNVPVVANRDSHASPSCVIACEQRLAQIRKSGRIAVDDRWLILREYHRYLRPDGHPGAGNMFLKWVFDNHKNPERCDLIPITNRENGFAEFPDDERLRDFDPADMKFVAVATAHPEHPPVLQAVDTKWRFFAALLAENGVTVEFLCADV